MKTVFSLLFLFCINETQACHFNQHVVSLSAPMTMIFEELNLLGDPKLLAISTFHPVDESQKFSAERLAGGIFLSKKYLKSYQKAFVFFDESQELKRELKKANIKSLVEFKSRGLDPFDVTFQSIKSLKGVTKGCEKKIKELKLKLIKIKQSFQLPTILKKSIYFLGEIKDQKPDLIIGDDSFVLFLKKSKEFKTYPTSLSYIPWSQKIMKRLKDYMLVGISSSQNNDLKVQKVRTKEFNFSMRGLLTPGIRQVYFLLQLQKLKM